MGYLAQGGYRSPTLRDAVSRWNEPPASQRMVVLTFDDGYDNFYQHAYPILTRYRLAATVFVVTEEIGGGSRWDSGYETPLMGWSQIKELSQNGIEIGSHTLTHPRLTQLAPPAARRDLLQSRLDLEHKLGAAVTSFAYPYGDHNQLLENLVAEAGYSAACSTI